MRLEWLNASGGGGVCHRLVNAVAEWRVRLELHRLLLLLLCLLLLLQLGAGWVLQVGDELDDAVDALLNVRLEHLVDVHGRLEQEQVVLVGEYVVAQLGEHLLAVHVAEVNVGEHLDEVAQHERVLRLLPLVVGLLHAFALEFAHRSLIYLNSKLSQS